MQRRGEGRDRIMRGKEEAVQPPKIIDRGRGPELAGTRITVYDIIPYLRAHWRTATIAILFRLSVAEVQALIHYIEEHRDEVMAENAKIEARIARGNPPEIEEKLKQSRGKAAALRDELRRKRQEANESGEADSPLIVVGPRGELDGAAPQQRSLVMGLSALTVQERDVVGRCLKATVEGPFIPDWEFCTLIGLYREDATEILARWPHFDDARQDVQFAINNSLNMLLYYPHEMPEAFKEWIGETTEEVERIYDKWRASCGLSP
jgi:uncharacterized protein (DUF433 family)